MKRIRKILAVLLAAVMVMSLGTSVLADSGSTSIKITGVATGSHTFKAYQIFDGDVSETTMSNVEWGTGVKSSDLLTALASLTDGETLYNYFSSITAESTASDVAEILATNNSDSTFVTAFAAFVEDYVTTEPTGSTSDGTQGEGETTYTYTISNLAEGYYLVLDSTTATSDDSVSKYMLQVLSGTDNPIATKTVVPTVTKTVTNTKEEESYATSASAGETVSFTLSGTIPSDAATYYTSYTYKFIDTLSSNLTYDADSLVVKANGTALTKETNYTVNTEDVTGGTQITITLSDAISYAGQTITVTYDATVSASISSSSAETNAVKVEYSNNPNDSTSTSTTTEEMVYVYTYDLELTKTYDSTAPTNHAQFTLYKVVSLADGAELGTGTYYTISGNTVTDATGIAASGTTYYTKVTTKTVSGESTYTATFNDLGEGTYVLIESYTPDGYNTADAVEFTISATYATDGSSVSSLTGTNVTSSGTNKVTMEIVNYSGSSLPTTGGIGTTIFYVVGAVLVLGAAVILITRRRMGNRA